jgi:hypothetical protein
MGTWEAVVGAKVAGNNVVFRCEKLRCPHSFTARTWKKLWMVNATTTVMLWTCSCSSSPSVRPGHLGVRVLKD